METRDYAFHFIEKTGKSVFLTGKAGTGKTTFLRQLKEQCWKNMVICAPTGVAAINAGGVTIHSLFQLPFEAFIPDNLFKPGVNTVQIGFNTPSTLAAKVKIRGEKRTVLQEVQLLVIDEVSMLRADILDAMDHILRWIRKNPKPFGGVQLLLIGDMLQLPPVVKEEEKEHLKIYYGQNFFFESAAIKKTHLVYLELDKVFRQNDPKFIDILNRLRENSLLPEDISFLNSYYRPEESYRDRDDIIMLTSHNRQADTVNLSKLSNLKGKEQIFRAEVEGQFNPYAFPIPEELVLKPGAQIMFIKNDWEGEGRFYNGKIGHYDGYDKEENKIRVKVKDEVIYLSPYTWENVQYEMNEQSGKLEEKIIGTFRLFPVKLAWAITIHKSQGLTFDHAVLDLGRVFAPGQMYVALSRLRSLDGLILSSKIQHSSIPPDDTLLAFGDQKAKPEKLPHLLTESVGEYFLIHLEEVLAFEPLFSEVQKSLEEAALDQNQSLTKQWETLLQKQLDAGKDFPELAGKFVRQIQQFLAQQGTDQKPGYIKERVAKASMYFSAYFSAFSNELIHHEAVLSKLKKVKSRIAACTHLEKMVFRKFLDVQLLIYLAECFEQGIKPDKVEMDKQRAEWLKEKWNKQAQAQAHAADQAAKVEEETKQGKLAGKQKKKEGQKNGTGKNGEPSSKEQSFLLFKAGMSVDEIAAVREMARSTIHGHLIHFIRTEEVDLDRLIQKDDLSRIQAYFKTSEEKSLKPAFEYFQEKYSYEELRIAWANWEYKTGQHVSEQQS